jgi:hypothetical protein
MPVVGWFREDGYGRKANSNFKDCSDSEDCASSKAAIALTLWRNGSNALRV